MKVRKLKRLILVIIKYSRKQIDKVTSAVKGMGASGLIWFRYENGEINSSINKFLNEEYNNALIERLELKKKAI